MCKTCDELDELAALAAEVAAAYPDDERVTRLAAETRSMAEVRKDELAEASWTD